MPGSRNRHLVSRRKALQFSAATFTSGFAGCQTIQSTLTASSRLTERWRHSFDGSLHDAPAVGIDLVYVSAGDAVAGLDRDTGAETWKMRVEDATIATAVGTLFIWENDSIGLRAFDVTNHDLRWEFDFVNMMPKVRDGVAYVTNVRSVQGLDDDDVRIEGGLQAVELESGRTRWTFSADEIWVPSAVTDDVAFVWVNNQMDGYDRPRGVYALSITDGAQQWRFEPDTPWGPTTFAEGTLVVGSDGVNDGPARVYGVDPATGTEEWMFETRSRSAFPRYVTSEHIVVLSLGERVETFVLDSSTGAVVWRAEDTVPRGTNGDFLYLTDIQADTIVAADITDGTERWTFNPDAAAEPPYAERHGETVFVVSADTIFGLDALTGDEHWRFTADRPLQRFEWVVHEDELYVATDERLYALTITE